MKTIHTFMLLFILVGFCHCRKTHSQVNYLTIISEAKQIFEKQYPSSNPQGLNKVRISETRFPDWQRYKKVRRDGREQIVVPVIYKKDHLIKNSLSNDLYLLSNISYLLINLTPQGSFKFQLLTIVPQTKIESTSFSGIIIVESWDGTPQYSYKYENGRKFVSAPNNSNLRTEGVIVINNYMNGYNYSPEDPDGGYAWQEYIGSTYISVPDYYGTGGNYGEYQDPWLGGLSDAEPEINPANLIVPAGENKITNLSEYTKCFSGGPGTEYEVTVFIEQPVPGSRVPWIIYDGSKVVRKGSVYSVGHTFIGIRQKNGASQIMRNVGFHPSDAVNPISPSTTGELDNDEDSYYDLSLTIPINQSQINNLISYIKNSGNATYDLNTYNCTTFVLDCLKSAGINLPRTEGSWPNGKGLNPADLGEDIRAMKLAPNMSRTIKNESHKNTGTCN